jgi:tripartite-type tricarboxylate transporter receptor subunit TctC
MTVVRREFLHLATSAATIAAMSGFARAQTYPSRQITMIVPYPPGGPADVVGRIVAERMRAALGQPIIIENVGGADGSIGIGRAARAKADGYTIVLRTSSTQVLNGALYSLLYDVVNDFAPVSPLVTNPEVLFARKTLGRNLDALIAWLKANPNKASAGFGASGAHLVAALFRKETDTQFTLVPYRTSSTAMQDLLAGEIELVFTTPDRLALMQAGRIKAYAMTGDTRSLAADIPTFRELGLRSLSFTNWYGLFAPKGTPREMVGRLHAATVETPLDAAVRSRLADLGFQVFPAEKQTPELLGTLVKAGVEAWWSRIRELGVKAE